MPRKRTLIPSPLAWSPRSQPVPPPPLPVSPSAEAPNSAPRCPSPSSTPGSKIRFPSAVFESGLPTSKNVRSVSGDYSVSGMEDSCVVERKDLADLIGSFTSNRAVFINRLRRMSRTPSQLARHHRVADGDQIRISLSCRQSQPHHAVSDRRARRAAPAFHLHGDSRTRRRDRRVLPLSDISV